MILNFPTGTCMVRTLQRFLATAILLFHCVFLQSQPDQFCREINSGYKLVTVCKDTFMIVSTTTTVKSGFYNSENTSCMFLKVKNGHAVDILFVREPQPDEEEYSPDDQPVSFPETEFAEKLLHPDTTLETDSTEYQYISACTIEHIRGYLFSVVSSKWQYTGGIHGFGNSSFEHYDARTNTFFDLVTTFTEGINEKLYANAKKEIKTTYPDWQFNESEVDSNAAGALELDATQYEFDSNGIVVINQMYSTLYGWIYLGYNEFSYSVPYRELKKLMRRESPLWRTLYGKECD